MVRPPSCLEKGKVYKVRIDFTSYRRGQKTPEATLLIDSVSCLLLLLVFLFCFVFWFAISVCKVQVD